MAWMPVDRATRQAMGLPTSDEGRERKIQLEQQGMASEEARDTSKQAAARGLETMRGQSAVDVANIQAAAQVEAARQRALQAGMYKGGPVIKAKYKGGGLVDISAWKAPLKKSRRELDLDK